jgi:hypothetical protein
LFGAKLKRRASTKAVQQQVRDYKFMEFIISASIAKVIERAQ